jgi:hypothetical protein
MLKQYWMNHGFELHVHTMKEDMMKEKKNILKSIVIIKPIAIVFIPAQQDIPISAGEFASSVKRYVDFLFDIQKATKSEVLFAGLSLRPDITFNSSERFIEVFAERSAFSLHKNSKHYIHVLDLVTSGDIGVGNKWLREEVVVPGWQASVNAGLIYALKQICQENNKVNFLRDAPP